LVLEKFVKTLGRVPDQFLLSPLFISSTSGSALHSWSSVRIESSLSYFAVARTVNVPCARAFY